MLRSRFLRDGSNRPDAGVRRNRAEAPRVTLDRHRAIPNDGRPELNTALPGIAERFPSRLALGYGKAPFISIQFPLTKEVKLSYTCLYIALLH